MTFFFKLVFSLLVLGNCAAFAWFYPAHHKSLTADLAPPLESADLGVRLQLASELPRSFFGSTAKAPVESLAAPESGDAAEAHETGQIDEDVFLR